MSESNSEQSKINYREIKFEFKTVMTTIPPTIPTNTSTTVTSALQSQNDLLFFGSGSQSQVNPQLFPSLEDNGVDAVNRVVNLPDFWTHAPEGWFVHAESTFALRRTSEKSKYIHLVNSLPADVLSRVMDLITNPDSEKTYETLKSSLLSRLSLSEEERINRVLYNMDMGDQKPYDFYRRMVQAAGKSGSLTGNLIYKLWIQRLPKIIQCGLIPLAQRPLEEILKVSDSLFEASKSISINEVARSAHSSAPGYTVSSIVGQVSEVDTLRAEVRSEIGELKEMIKNLSFSNSDHSRSRDRGRSNCSCNCHRGKSSNNRSRSRSKGNFCYYHAKYGVKAHKCIQPCSFVVKPTESKPSKNN